MVNLISEWKMINGHKLLSTLGNIEQYNTLNNWEYAFKAYIILNKGRGSGDLAHFSVA